MRYESSETRGEPAGESVCAALDAPGQDYGDASTGVAEREKLMDSDICGQKHL